jgi:hypothetical protein
MNSPKALIKMKVNRWGNAYFAVPQDVWIDEVTKEQIAGLKSDLTWLNNRIALVFWIGVSAAELVSRMIVPFLPFWFSLVVTALAVMYACYGWLCHKTVTKRLENKCKQNSHSHFHWELEAILYCAVWRDATITIQRQP